MVITDVCNISQMKVESISSAKDSLSSYPPVIPQHSPCSEHHSFVSYALSLKSVNVSDGMNLVIRLPLHCAGITRARLLGKDRPSTSALP